MTVMTALSMKRFETVWCACIAPLYIPFLYLYIFTVITVRTAHSNGIIEEFSDSEILIHCHSLSFTVTEIKLKQN